MNKEGPQTQKRRNGEWFLNIFASTLWTRLLKLLTETVSITISNREALWSSFQASVSNVASSSSSSRPVQEPKKVKIERKYLFAGEQVVLVFFFFCVFFMALNVFMTFPLAVRSLKFLRTPQKQKSGICWKKLLRSHQVRHPLRSPFRRLQYQLRLRPTHLHLLLKRQTQRYQHLLRHLQSHQYENLDLANQKHLWLPYPVPLKQRNLQR